MARPRFPLTDEIIGQLGKVSDSELARQANCSVPTISSARQRKSIPPFGRRVERKSEDESRDSAVQKALKAAKPSSEGMLIPFDLFAAACHEVLK